MVGERGRKKAPLEEEEGEDRVRGRVSAWGPALVRLHETRGSVSVPLCSVWLYMRERKQEVKIVVAEKKDLFIRKGAGQEWKARPRERKPVRPPWDDFPGFGARGRKAGRKKHEKESNRSAAVAIVSGRERAGLCDGGGAWRPGGGNSGCGRGRPSGSSRA